MKSPKHVILYGFLAWLVWMPTVMGLMMLMPKEYAATIVGMSLPAILFFISVSVFALLYLRKIGQSNWKEGFTVGIVWIAIFGAFDILHYMLMGAFNPAAYLSGQFPVYLGLLAVLSLLFGLARSKNS